MSIEQKVKDTIKKYKLFKKKDKIAVAASGGKDSATALYILKKLGYNVTALTVDALIGNYTKENLENLRAFCKQYDIPLIEINFKDEFGAKLCYLRSLLQSKGFKYNSCTICGVLRRHLVNKYAKKYKFDKLVTGHNLDDEAQATLMNIFRNDHLRFKRMGPLVGTVNSKRFVQRVKPLYFIYEKEIIKFTKKMKWPMVYAPCPCGTIAYRTDAKKFLLEFPDKVKKNIVEFAIKNNPKIRTEATIKACTICGEPSNNDVCKACELLKAVAGGI